MSLPTPCSTTTGVAKAFGVTEAWIRKTHGNAARRIAAWRHQAELTERQHLDAGAALTHGQRRLRHRAAVPFVPRVGHERDAFVSDRDKPAAWNLGSVDPIVKNLQLETFCGHLLEDKDFGLDFCHAVS
jgi:hypothetical protein